MKNSRNTTIFLLVTLTLMLILSSCSNNEISLSEETAEYQTNRSAKILNVRTNLAKEDNWWIVSENMTDMTITVDAENTDTVLFWIAPTGTETGKERTLIGYDVDGSDGWSYTWEFGERIFHDHIQVQALGMDGSTQASETINVHSS